jgi:hypothetical protein
MLFIHLGGFTLKPLLITINCLHPFTLLPELPDIEGGRILPVDFNFGRINLVRFSICGDKMLLAHKVVLNSGGQNR